MGRYTGPVEKLSRREGVELFLKGERALNGKSALERRGDNPPGQHGATRRRRPSIYSTQLRAKQTAKRYYGVRERQFRRYVSLPTAPRASPARSCCGCSSAGWTTSSTGSASPARAPRRGSSSTTATCGGRHKVDIASVKPGMTITIRPVREIASASTELTGSVGGWLQTDFDSLEGKVLRLPERSDINAPVNEQLIVELYSRL